MLGGHFSAPIDTGSGPVLSLAVCTAFRVGDRMSCDGYKNIAHTGILYQIFENFDLTNTKNGK